MPELPEVETMRRGILPVLGARIEKAQRTACAKKPIVITPRIDHLNRRVAGKKIASVDRLGKRVVLKLDSDDRLIFEPRMTGLVLLSDPPTSEHLRFCLELSKSKIKRILFWDRRGLGNVSLLSAKQFAAKLSDGTLGPDALQISSDELADCFRGSQREIKVALLDQSAVAGIGNLYASEILHMAQIHPQTRCQRLTKKRWLAIFDAMNLILKTAIKYEGSTLSDGTYRNALNQSGSYQNEHQVYDRAGQLCPRCAQEKPTGGSANKQPPLIKRIVQAQRSTFFCSRCQTKR